MSDAASLSSIALVPELSGDDIGAVMDVGVRDVIRSALKKGAPDAEVERPCRITKSSGKRTAKSRSQTLDDVPGS